MIEYIRTLIAPYLAQIEAARSCIAATEVCNIDKSLTPQSTLFIVVTLLLFVITTFFYLRVAKKSISTIILLATGVFIFELFTAPLWNSLHLGKFGYLYLDISWILTLAWTGAFMTSFMLVDRFFPKLKQKFKFFLYILPMIIYTIAVEMIMVFFGMRTYAPEIAAVSIGYFFNIPIEVFYYAPVFSGLVIAFFKFWEQSLLGRPFLPTKRRFSLRNFIVLSIAIISYELLVEPLVINAHFPVWSYIYQDISVVRILIWMAVIWLSTLLVDRFVHTMQYPIKFVGYVSLSMVILLQIESWFMSFGFRVYSDSAVQNFTGIVTPISQIPIEVAFAIPLYLVLILSYVGYWRMTLDNNL